MAEMPVSIEIIRPNDKDAMIVGAVAYRNKGEEKPGEVRLLFRDGTTEIYDMRVEQPAPQVVESIKIIRRMKQGYVNQPMRRRRNRG